MKGPSQDTCAMMDIHAMEQPTGSVGLMVCGVEQNQLVKVRYCT